MIENHTDLYDASYYASHLGPIPYERNHVWLEFFSHVANKLIEKFHPRTTFDAGCAFGFLVEAFRDRGVEAYGRDISAYAIEQSRPDIAPFCEVKSLTEPLTREYDLLTCIEVLEHLTEADALIALDHMTRAAQTIVFSSSPSDFTEPTHINVQPVLYWLQQFAKRGFGPVLFDTGFLAPQSFAVARRDSVAEEDVIFFDTYIRLKLDKAEKEQALLNIQKEDKDPLLLKHSDAKATTPSILKRAVGKLYRSLR